VLTFKAVIFDWDGTLADTKKAVVQSFQTTLTKAGCNVSNEFIIRLIGVGTKKTIIEAFRECNKRLDISTLEKLAQQKIDTQASLTDLVNLFEGTTELLEALKGKVKIAVATMSGRKVIDKLLSEKKLANYFDVVVSADDINQPKPDPEIFLLAASQLNVAATDCVVVEDSVFGVRAAKAANMKCVAVSSGAYSSGELLKEKPDLAVGSVAEKKAILKVVFDES
jgi:HAD superfamily hydrolase (TIGR01509 family)